MNTNKKKQIKKNILEKIKWFFIFFIFTTAIVGNYYYKDSSFTIIRLLVIIFLLIIMGIIYFFTLNGKSTISFILNSRIEAKKVFWPSRQETLHTTLIIALITIITSLIFWGLDTILILCVSFLTNLRFF